MATKEQFPWLLFDDCFTQVMTEPEYLLPRVLESAISIEQAAPSWKAVETEHEEGYSPTL